MLRIATIVLFLSFFSALWNNSNAASPIRVTATTTVVADLVEQVGGDLVVVESLMADGVDPHSYRATPRDIDRLVRADLIVANGLHLEGKLAELLERIGRKRPFVAVGEAVPQDELLPIGNGLFDPHIWFDAKLWSYCPFAVADALIQLDSEAASHYQHRGKSIPKIFWSLMRMSGRSSMKFLGSVEYSLRPTMRSATSAGHTGLRLLVFRERAQKVKLVWLT